MRLREIQRAFAAGILTDDSAAIAARLRAGRFGAERHLQIYRNNVYASLAGALEAVYPVVARLVGPDCFRGCAHAYVREAPPTSGNLHDFGASFPAFLSVFEPVRALAYLPDVAHLEWAWHCAFHAAEAAPLSLDALAQVPTSAYGELRFKLHPSAHLRASPYPLLEIWQANQPDGDSERQIDLDRGGGHLLIIRRALTVEIERLAADEHALLCAFAEGCALAEAAQRASTVDGGFDLSAALRARVQDQTITGFDSDPQLEEENA